MPTLFSFFGMRFQFFSKEHLPIHIHVIKDNVSAKWVLEPEISLVENNGMKPQELKLAESIIEENRDNIISRWKAFFSDGGI
jgi:hypothetical protein